MRRHSGKPKYGPGHIEALLHKIAAGQITPEDLVAMVSEVDPMLQKTTPAHKTGEEIIHATRNLTLSRRQNRKESDWVWVYELEWRLAGTQRFWQGLSIPEVLGKARNDFPKEIRSLQHTGEILAFRGWHLSGEFLTPLATRAARETWYGPVAIADEKPTEHNDSGLYAVHMTQKRLAALITNYHPDVYGFVGLFGTVWEHELGYRAERAVIRRLILRVPATQAFTALLSNRYECDVVIEKGFRK